MSKNVIIYCRVSSDEQNQNSSLGYQEETMREYCRRNQYNIVDCYKEDYSAKTFIKRPEINKVMKYCKAHKKEVDLILCLNWSRYSRNAKAAYENLDYFKSLDIEVNTIEQPIDHLQPEQKFLLAIYLTQAEVDNDIRGNNTKKGIIGKLRQGHCTNKAPRGYINRQISKHDKYVEIDESKAKIIRQIFNQVAKGVETPSYIRKQLARKSFDISESSFFEMLRNHFYIGEVRVPEFYDEANKKTTPEHYVKGLHEAIIDKETFYKVQDVIDGKKKKQPKLSKKIHPDAFLRGYLKCPVCDGTITGAPSTGNGGTYYYYNCRVVPKHFRCRADDAINKFVSFTAGLKPNKEILDLYNEILCDLKRDRDGEKRIEADSFNTELSKAKSRLQKLEDMYMDGEITKDSFNGMQERYKREINNLQDQIELYKNPNRSNIEPKLRYSMLLINNIDSYMRDAKVEVKCKLLSSMFPEKITFDGKSYRTNSYNSVLDLIYKQTNELRGIKKENGESFNTFSASVPRAST